jgi:crossover junction endodeoxyribonuclease RuvC
MLICGIDPGKTGALAFVRSDPAHLDSVISMPLVQTRGRRTPKTIFSANWHAVAAALRESEPDLVVIEQQGARPGMSAKSTFSIAHQYGALIGICSALGLPFETVLPSVWKVRMGLKGLDKDASRARAIQLMPEGAAFFTRQLDHGRAEAALIGMWKVAYEQPDRSRA